ncbi:MAG TPA: S8 family serine peptidase, partial [Candidatus Binatia bacterium]|nr:S8 family serine peptidase [Candidatus Binatia bacterium]
ITVGSLEQFRDLTNTYTPLNSTNEVLAWQAGTSSSSEVAGYSARGNVGIQTEGQYGRFKPDVVAPGNFVVSTRPSMWDKAAYYNPTNYHTQFSQYGAVATPDVLAYGGGTIPSNAVALNIRVESNPLSPNPFPTNFPIYISLSGVPSATNYDVATSNNVLSIPPGGGSLTGMGPLIGNTFVCAVGDPTNELVDFDMVIQIVTTNDDGNLLTVLSNLNETLSPYYYYNSGTSVAAAGASGSLALIQDYFTNTLQTTPSPALLKAMLINGARLTPGYNEFAVTNSINFEGWGLVNVPNSVPAGLTNTAALSTNTPMFFVDQSPTNALATGDSRTYTVSVPSAAARNQLMRITLAWTDPPGNPAASIKLVNNLDLVVTNLDTGAVYYGNSFDSGATPFSPAVSTNTLPD